METSHPPRTGSARRDPPPPPPSSPGLGITIRELTSNEDCRAGVALQKEIWGAGMGDVVPASLFHVVGYVGGLAAGAFDAAGIPLGFVFGVTGVRDGVLSHWSHMLGVRESARNAGVGRMLKEFQRTALARLGVVRVYWTFDPLQAKNAYFNLHRLGAQIDEYVPDMYGDTGSPLHLGLPTDRLIVHIRASGRDYAPPPLPSYEGIPILTPFPRQGDGGIDNATAKPPVVLIEIPADILTVTSRSVDEARRWRLGVRDHFHWALDRGYVVNGVHRDPASARTFYVAAKRPAL